MIISFIVVVGALVGPLSLPPSQSQDEPVCRFAVRPLAGRASIVQGPGFVASPRVLSQPDAPLAIVRADVSGVTFGIVGASYNLEGPYRIEVQNVSDRHLERARVQLRVRWRNGGADLGADLAHRLSPGGVARLEGGWSANGSAPGGLVDLVFVVDSVDLEGCTYRPAQALRTIGATSR